MTEVKIIKEFSCTKCGEKETVTGIAVEEQIQKGKIQPGIFYSMRKEIIPLIEPAAAQLTVPTMVVHWDLCANCGTLYPIRVETLDMPIRIPPPKGDFPRGLSFGRG